jgi:hypothetical protein
MSNSQPPSRKETTAEPTKTLEWISARLSEIYTIPTPPTLSRAAYSNLHSAVWTFCTSARAARRSTTTTPIWNSQDLYERVEQLIQSYCQANLAYIESADQVLATYTIQWTTFLQTSSLVTHLLQNLGDNWIRGHIDVGSPRIYQIAQLHLKFWKEEVLMKSTKIVDAMQQNSGERKSEEDKQVLEDSLASLRKVGVELRNGRLVDLEQ